MQATFRNLSFLVLGLIVGFSQANVSHAQSDLAAEDLATVRFDFQIQKFREGEFGQAIEAELDAFIPQDINRVWGAMTLPKTEAGIQELNRLRVPEGCNAFVRIECVDAGAADKGFNTIKSEEGAGSRKIGDETYVVYPDRERLLVHRINETTIEFGTELYLTQASRQLSTEKLDAAFAKTPDGAFRIVMDLDGASEYTSALKQATPIIPGGIPPANTIFCRLMERMSELRICVDFADDGLLSMGVTGNHASEAEELHEGLGQVVEVAKLMGKHISAKITDPEVEKSVSDFFANLKLEQEGGELLVHIARPSNFAAVVKAAVQYPSHGESSPSADDPSDAPSETPSNGGR